MYSHKKKKQILDFLKKSIIIIKYFLLYNGGYYGIG